MHSRLSSFRQRLIHLIGQVRDQSLAAASFPFEELALELFALQAELNPVYRRFCQSRGAIHARDLLHVPALPVSAFKDYAATSLEQSERTAFFESSGTTASRRSVHYHCPDSLRAYETSLLAAFSDFVFDSSRSASMHFLSLTPTPELAPHSSLAHMAGHLSRHLPWKSASFLGELNARGQWQVRADEAARRLQEAQEAAHPVFIFGTAFNFVNLLDAFSSHRFSVSLPEGSVGLETGGYKSFSRALPREELHASIHAKLAVGKIVREYGMSELSSQAYAWGLDSPFQFPPWARALVISPETGKPVAAGETGLLRIFDLANIYSVMALQSEDLAVARPDGGFELVGRLQAAEPRGCSLHAA